MRHREARVEAQFRSKTILRGESKPAMADPVSIAVIGSGVVGTATGAGFAANGHRVVFCDIDPGRVALLKTRGFDAVHPSALIDLQASAYLICVPSPTVDERV